MAVRASRHSLVTLESSEKSEESVPLLTQVGFRRIVTKHVWKDTLKDTV
jgi:hypothetical protein